MALWPELCRYRWGYVVRRGVVIIRLPGSLPFGMAQEEHDIRQLRPERLDRLAHYVVLAESMTVVRKDDDQGVLEQVQVLHLLEEVAQPAVGHGDLGGVKRAHPLQLPLCEVVAQTLAGGIGLSAVVIVVVEVDVLLRGVPRLVRIVAVDHHEERLGRRP